MRKRITVGSILLLLVGAGWIGMDKYLSYCAANPSDTGCPFVDPSPAPTVTPSPIPTEEPTPDPLPTTTPTPEAPPTPPPPPPPPTLTPCPKFPAEGSYIRVNNKRYGNGIDSTYRINGDPEMCFLIHGVRTNECHFEGMRGDRAACEMWLAKRQTSMAGGCPIWQYVKMGAVYPCLQAPHIDQSCDHFGDPVYRDDPQTPNVFEGNPAECGLQRDASGDPMAGFFVISHGLHQTRACLPDGTNCGPWVYGKDVR